MGLVLCEICNWADPGVRFIAWRLFLTVLVSQLVVLIPATQLGIHFRAHSGSLVWRYALPVVLFGVYLAAFYVLGWWLPVDTSSKKKLGDGLMSGVLVRVAFVGVTMMGVLTGVSSVSAPYTVFIARPKPVSEQDVERLEQSLRTTTDLTKTKEQDLASLRRRARERASHASGTSSIMMKVFSSLRGDDLTNEIKALEVELGALSKMTSELGSELEMIKVKFEEQERAKTVSGRIVARFYAVFAVYCVYRLLNVCVLKNPFGVQLLPKKSLSGSSESDAIVTILAHAIQDVYPTRWDVESLSRLLGFAVSGVLLLMSVNSVRATFQTVARAFPMLKVMSAFELTALVGGQVLGTYVVATSLLLRTNLPRSMSSSLTAAIGIPLDADVTQAWFDATMFIAIIASAVAIYIASKVRVDSLHYDEETFLEGKRD